MLNNKESLIENLNLSNCNKIVDCSAMSTAEKDLVINHLAMSLIDIINQYHKFDDGYFYHSFMQAGESAADIMEAIGLGITDAGGIKLNQEICKILL